MQPFTPCLWFDDQAEEAAQLYVSVFDDARIVSVQRYRGEQAVEVTGKETGSVLTVQVEIGGQRLTLLNGGPRFTFSEAVSLIITCRDQAEIDRYWEALTSNGGAPSQCGWLKDRFGFSWQVVPDELEVLMDDSDPARAARVMDAIMPMQKLDIAKLRDAAAAPSRAGAAR